LDYHPIIFSLPNTLKPEATGVYCVVVSVVGKVLRRRVTSMAKMREVARLTKLSDATPVANEFHPREKAMQILKTPNKTSRINSFDGLLSRPNELLDYLSI